MTAPRAGQVRGADDVTLRTLAWTVPSPVGRALVVHGFAEHGARYGELAGSLNAAGWSVLAYDQRGHGHSGGRRGVLASFDRLLHDLVRVRERLDESAPGPGAPVLLGHSLGALVVVRHLQGGGPDVGRVRGLVLSAPWLRTAARVPAWKRAAAAVMGRVAPDLTLPSGLRAEQLTRDPAAASAWQDDPLVHDRISTRLWNAVLSAQEAALAAGPPPGVPTLVLLPDDDPVADSSTAERWAARGSGDLVRVVRLEGRRHEPFHDLGRHEVLDTLVAWLAARGEPGHAEEPHGSARVSPATLSRPGDRRGRGSSMPRNATRNP